MSDNQKIITRRETLKLAAAVAGFGAALGFERAEAQGPTQLKRELKRIELKFYVDDKIVDVHVVPTAVVNQIKVGQKVEYKLYRNFELSTGGKI